MDRQPRLSSARPTRLASPAALSRPRMNAASPRFLAFWISSSVRPSFLTFSISAQISFSRSSGLTPLSRRGVALNWKAPTYHWGRLEAEALTASCLSRTRLL